MLGCAAGGGSPRAHISRAAAVHASVVPASIIAQTSAAVDLHERALLHAGSQLELHGMIQKGHVYI